MNYVIGLSGTHGTGKSTIIQGVKNAGYPVDESQMSRAAQKKLGWESLAPATESAENIWLLQDAILDAMCDRDMRIQASKTITLVDRTPADVAAYVVMWLYKLDYIGPQNRELNFLFNRKCGMMISNFYSRLVYVPICSEIPFVAEPNRADEQDRDFHDKHLQNFLNWGWRYDVKSISKEERVAEVCSLMEMTRLQSL